MTEPILKLNNLTKTYIVGRRKNAKRAQKAISALQKKYEKFIAKNNELEAKKVARVLQKAQTLFANEQYEASYKTVTGKSLRKRPRDRGSVIHALNSVDLRINKGDLVAVIGPSGSGKSTLLNMLGLLDDPSSGQMFLNGKSVASISHNELPEIRSRELGFVFQSFNLVPTLTALENVMLPLRYSGMHIRKRRKTAAEALQQVGLEERIKHTPSELSGGQQQRVAIARSIVNKPSIILGDELTGELDSKMTAQIMKLIKKLNANGQTFIIVTHNPEVAKACKRVIHMRDGRVVKDIKQVV